MRPCAPRWLLAALCCCLAAPVAAQPFGHAAGFDRLYRIDLGSGQATELGAIGFVDVEGLAMAPDGTLYGVADAGASSGSAITDLLIRLDPVSGAGTLVAPLAGLQGLGPGAFGDLDYGLAFTCDGRLWLSSDTTATLWEVDPASGATTVAADLGAPVSGLAATRNVLYGISVSDDRALYRIDPDAGSSTRVGALGIALNFFDAGLDFDAAGNLWATIDYVAPPEGLPDADRSDIALIDPITGTATITGPVLGVGSVNDIVQMEGLAIAPPACATASDAREVPGPSAPVLALLGLLSLLAGGLAIGRRA